MLTPIQRISLCITTVLHAASTITTTTCAFQFHPTAVAPTLLGSNSDEHIISPRGKSGMLLFASNEQTTAEVEGDLYNDEEEEIQIEIDLENIEEEINDDYSSGEDSAGWEDVDEKMKKRLIECTASITLPFSEDVAFDAFSDLTRQPSWSKYLQSVEYLGLLDTIESDIESSMPLRETKWTVDIKGLKYSWTAKDIKIVRPKRMEWESTSGVKNMGSVQFIPQTASSSASTTTQMILQFTYVAPRVVSSVFRRSGKIRKYTEDVIMMGMLTDFRDVVMEEDL